MSIASMTDHTSAAVQRPAAPATSIPVLAGVTAAHLDPALPGLSHDELESLLWIDSCSEYDGRNLYAHLTPRLPGFSAGFRRMFSRWHRDEQDHYLGLRHLYCCLTGEAPEALDARMADRPVDFTAIEPFLAEEFTILVALAYDELVTVQAYKKDYWIYDKLGHPAIGEWIRKVNREEARHYLYALRLLVAEHGHRAGEVPALVEKLIDYDEGRNDYKATFLLDHWDGDTYFQSDDLRRCGETLCRQVSQRCGRQTSRPVSA